MPKDKDELLFDVPEPSVEEQIANEVRKYEYQVQDLSFKLVNSENTNRQLVEAIKNQETDYLILLGKAVRELMNNR